MRKIRLNVIKTDEFKVNFELKQIWRNIKNRLDKNLTLGAFLELYFFLGAVKPKAASPLLFLSALGTFSDHAVTELDEMV